MPTVRPNQTQEKIYDLRNKLRALDAEFEREMRARGFDPAQAENVALPTELSRLYTEREAIREKLEEMSGHQSEKEENSTNDRGRKDSGST
jgi:predicted nuclease with TOPRIM domain